MDCLGNHADYTRFDYVASGKCRKNSCGNEPSSRNIDGGAPLQGSECRGLPETTVNITSALVLLGLFSGYFTQHLSIIWPFKHPKRKGAQTDYRRTIYCYDHWKRKQVHPLRRDLKITALKRGRTNKGKTYPTALRTSKQI